MSGTNGDNENNIDDFLGQPLRSMTGDALRHELGLMRKTMRRIVAMAGHPDAAQACRNIIAECKNVMPDIRNQSEEKTSCIALLAKIANRLGTYVKMYKEMQYPPDRQREHEEYAHLLGCVVTAIETELYDGNKSSSLGA